MTAEVRVHDELTIPTPDGQRLTATLYEPVGPLKAVLQIHGGIGVKRQFYRNFANYLAANGFAVLAFDFRGTGGSRPKSLRGYRASLHEWGHKDLPAVLDWVKQRYPSTPVFAIGHSMGGQLTGLMHNHAQLRGIVLIFAATGHFRTFPLPFMLFPIFMLYLYFPLTIPLFGYAPARFVTAGQDLPSGIAWEWVKWTLHPGYLARFMRNHAGGYHYDQVRVPIKAFAVDDDPMATPANCQQFLKEYFPNAPATLTTLRASDAPKSQVGHLGYFRKGLADAYWSQIVTWLDERVARGDTSEATASHV